MRRTRDGSSTAFCETHGKTTLHLSRHGEEGACRSPDVMLYKTGRYVGTASEGGGALNGWAYVENAF